MRLSVVIPTRDEVERIGPLVTALRDRAGLRSRPEVVVADAGSGDGTAAAARRAGARVVPCPAGGRGAAMNAGAAATSGDVLLFLHADTRPPPCYTAHIAAAVAGGAVAGCFRLRFDDPHPLLRASAWCTRFDLDAIRFGDQGLFVRRDVWERVGGFRPDLLLFEDQEIVGRLRRHGPFRVLSARVVTSARRYRAVGVLRLQLVVFPTVILLYRLGLGQERLVRVYRRLLGAHVAVR